MDEEEAIVENAADLPGVPDGYERLWTPHRLVYLREGQQPKDCPFCAAPNREDADGLIVHRGRLGYVIMNLYPYNSGHIMVCPYRHIATYDLASEEEIQEIGLLTQQAMRVVKAVMNCDGFNIGMNQGRVAGAGIAEHLHQHLVPRWALDANFFPIIARTKALPQLIEQVREKLAQAWESCGK